MNRWLLPTAILAILPACDGAPSLNAPIRQKAMAISDFGSLPICTPLKHLPKNGRLVSRFPNDPNVKGECVPVGGLSCEFELNSDPGVIYLAEMGRIRSKSIPLNEATDTIGLIKGDDIETIKAKLKNRFGPMELYEDLEGGAILKSPEYDCPGDVYSVIVGLDEKYKADTIIISSLPMN